MRDQYLQLWNNLNPRARLVIIMAVVLCLAGLTALSRAGNATQWVPLYTGLSGQDAGGIVEKLKTEKTPYRLTQGGTTIEVPQENVYELRVAMAKEGLPTSGQIGFELFDRSNLPGTQFNNQVNYQRALQGELSRTICAMDEVAAARVHVVLPEENLFSEQTKASASVVVQPKAGRAITREATLAIASIVASSVRDVKAEEVTIADSSGKVLAGGGTSGSLSGLTGSQLEIQQQYEERVTRNLQSMLDSVLGPNKSVVRVQAQFDFDREEVKNETLTPVGQGKGLLASETVKQEQYRGTGGGGGSAAAGLQPNIGRPATGGGAPGGGSYLHRDETREYQYSRSESQVVKSPGKVKNLTVAAIIDETLASSAEQQVKDALSAASGINARRGDIITVQRMKIDAADAAKTQQQEMVTQEKSRQRQTFMQGLLRSSMTLAGAGLVVFMILVLMRQLRQVPGLPGLPAAQEATAGALAGEAARLGLPAEQHPLQPPEQWQAIPVESNHPLSSMRQQLRQVADVDADMVANRLLHLMDEEEN